jgi:carbamoyl-phosphate synthase large subunit
MTEPLPVVVTAVGGGALGSQLMKALRSASTPYRIIGCDVKNESPGLMEADATYLLPFANAPDYCDVLRAVCTRENAKVVLVGSEPEIKRLSGASMEGLFIPLNPPNVLDVCFDKVKTMKRVSSLGFRTPRTEWVETVEDLKQIDFFPVVIKPAVGSGGSTHVYIAQSREELLSFGSYLLSLGHKTIVQEYVGTPHDEYTVGVLLSMDGVLVNSIAMLRYLSGAMSVRSAVVNRTGRTDLGSSLAVSTGISQGFLGAFPEVTRPCEALAEKLGCRGAVNIQCRMVDGEPWVFEINPRFSGTTSSRALLGYNEPDVLIRHHVLGEPLLVRFAYNEGLVLRSLKEVVVEAHPTIGRNLL